MDLKIDRNPNFFAHYGTQSEDFKTYVLKDEEKKVHAAASFIFKDACTDGKVQTMATAVDLRVSNNRRAILQWSQHFLPVLEKETSDNHVSGHETHGNFHFVAFKQKAFCVFHFGFKVVNVCARAQLDFFDLERQGSCTVKNVGRPGSLRKFHT